MKFKYKAITISGRKQIGKVNAFNKEKAIDLLQKHKLVIISIEPVKEIVFLSRISYFLHRVSSKDIVVFFKELSTLLMAGMPLLEALRVQYEHEENLYFKEKIFAIISKIDDGASFSSSLSYFPNIFSNFYVSVIRSGEVSGNVRKSLINLSNYIEKQHLLASKIKNALMYPAVILSGFGIVGVGMMIFVVPQLVKIFEENRQELPLPTKILIAVSDFMHDNYILIALFTLLIFYVVKKYIKTKKGKRNFDKLIINLPGLGMLFRKFYIARFTKNLSMLIGSGIPIISALKISGDSAGNEIYKEIIYNSVDEVKTGGSIAHAFERSDQLPSLVTRMIEVGEKSGKLDVVLKDISDFYTKEIDIAVDGLMSLIEPVLILILGGGVGVLVASILLPVYQMTTMF